MVSVDYATLNQIIRQSLYTGIFSAKITTTRPRQEGEIELYIQNGVILSCFFTDVRGQRYKWDQWEAQLESLGVLNWDSKALPPPEVAPPPPPRPSFPNGYQLAPSAPRGQIAGIPYQEIALSPTQLAQLPLACRRVYFLVNGSRSISDIALTLGRPPQEIAQIIEYLSQFGFVRLR